MIFVSAGHHEDKKGACFEGFCEHDEAKIWVSLIAHHLGYKGMVVPTGTLKNKVQFINDMASIEDIAIEIHFNSAKDEAGNNVGKGSETLYFPSSIKGRWLATRVQEVLSETFKPDRGPKEGWYRMNKIFGPDYFLQRTRCVALILEPDFIHRKEVIQSQREVTCKNIARLLYDNDEE